MGKHGIGGHPPKVGTSNEKKEKPSDHKVVGTDGKPLSADKLKKGNEIREERMAHMGQFALPQQLLYQDFDGVMDLMGDILITRAELQQTPMGNIFVYTGVSPRYFELLPEGSQIPMYDIARHADGSFSSKKREEPRIQIPPPGMQIPPHSGKPN